jgi:hypothetical protein
MLPQLKYLDNTDRDGGKNDESSVDFGILLFIFDLVEKDSDDEDDDENDDEEEDYENGDK